MYAVVSKTFKRRLTPPLPDFVLKAALKKEIMKKHGHRRARPRTFLDLLLGAFIALTIW